MTEQKIDWGYVAGFFDGEGNLHVSTNGIGKDGIPRITVRARFYSTALPALEALQKFLGFGKIYFNSNSRAHELSILKKEDLKFLLRKIRARVVIKKSQVDFLLDHYNFKNNKNNSYFDVDQFRSFITRKNVEAFRKLKTYNIPKS